jgi:hypothetical protein
MSTTAQQSAKPRGGAPVGNQNARKHGLYTVRRRRKEARQLVLDSRTSEFRIVQEERDRLVAALGGDVSPQQEGIIIHVAQLGLDAAIIRGEMAQMSSLVNRTRRAAYPILHDWLSVVRARADLLTRLGLERKARGVPSLQEYLNAKAERAGTGEVIELPSSAEAPSAEQGDST